MSSPRGSSQPKDQTQVSCIAGGFFSFWSTREAPFFSVPVGFWVPAGPSVVCYSVGLCQASGSSRYPSVEAWLFPISGEGRAVGYRPRACRCFQTESRPCQVSAGDGEWSGPTGFGMMPSRFLWKCPGERGQGCLGGNPCPRERPSRCGPCTADLCQAEMSVHSHQMAQTCSRSTICNPSADPSGQCACSEWPECSAPAGPACAGTGHGVREGEDG